MKVIFCSECNTPFILHRPVLDYYDDMMKHAPKLKFLCKNCGSKVPLGDFRGKLLAIQGADYIEDFGEW